MMRYQHAIIAHGKAIAEALSREYPFSIIETRRVYNSDNLTGLSDCRRSLP